jgi:hypothetical protein
LWGGIRGAGSSPVRVGNGATLLGRGVSIGVATIGASALGQQSNCDGSTRFGSYPVDCVDNIGWSARNEKRRASDGRAPLIGKIDEEKGR